MIRTLTLALLLASPLTTAFAQDATAEETPAKEASGKQAPAKGDAKGEDKESPAVKIGTNLKDEATAIKALAKAVRAEVDAGTILLTEEASGRWKRGMEVWDAVLVKVDAKDYKGAYADVTEARDLMSSSLLVAFERTDAVPSSLRDAVKGYFDAVSPRIDAVKRYTEKHELPADAQASFDAGKGKWTEARDLAKDKKYGQALSRVMEGMNELDKVVRWVYHNRG